MSLTGLFSKPLYCKVIQLQHSYTVFHLKSIRRCKTSFSHIWHQEVHPEVQAMFPLTTMDIKALCVLNERAGFSFTRITNKIIRVSQHSPYIALSTLQKPSFLFNNLLLLLLLLLSLRLLLKSLSLF